MIVTAVDKLAYANFQIRKMLFFSKIVEMFCEDKFVDLAGTPFVPLNNSEFYASLPIDDSIVLADKRKYLQMDNLINAVGNFMQSNYFDHPELAGRLVMSVVFSENIQCVYDDKYPALKMDDLYIYLNDNEKRKFCSNMDGNSDLSIASS